MRLRILACFGLLVLGTLVLNGCVQSTEPPATEEVAMEEPANPLRGAWSVTQLTPGGGEATIDPAQPGLYVFTDSHYGAVYTISPEPRPHSAVSFDPTAEEKVAQYDSIIVNSGTYDVDGDVITFRPMIAKSPVFAGGEARVTFAIDGDILTFTQQGVTGSDGASPADAGGAMMVLERVE